MTLLRRTVQHQADEIERGDSGQPLCEISKQGREIPVQRNRLGNLQEGLARIAGTRFEFGRKGVSHGE
ncbi:MAG: hypothetical protein IPL14_08285 [Nitrospira sp.]|nr:hypothetical protein [Nitrospira sp.]